MSRWNELCLDTISSFRKRFFSYAIKIVLQLNMLVKNISEAIWNVSLFYDVCRALSCHNHEKYKGRVDSSKSKFVMAYTSKRIFMTNATLQTEIRTGTKGKKSHMIYVVLIWLGKAYIYIYHFLLAPYTEISRNILISRLL